MFLATPTQHFVSAKRLVRQATNISQVFDNCLFFINNVIHQINCYPVDKCRQNKLYLLDSYLIWWIVLSLVLICCWHTCTWFIANGTTWDTIMVYVNIYCRIIICPRQWPPACLRQPAVVGDETILWEHHQQTQRTPLRWFEPYLLVKCWKFDLHFVQIWVCRRSIPDAPGPTGTDRETLPVATGDVTGRSARYEN